MDSPPGKMYVVNRKGDIEDVAFDKITERIRKLCGGLDTRFVDPAYISQKVVQGVYPGITTAKLDDLAAETAAYAATLHPDFSILAARIAISNLHRQTENKFSDVAARLHAYVHPKTGKPAPLIADEVYAVIEANKEKIDAAVDYTRDFDFDFFGFKTLERSYLLKLDDGIAERPQHMYMRVALGIHMGDVDAAIETYDLMSKRFFTHATPTLFNAGTPRPQLSSCFLLTMEDDSIEGIYSTLARCASISKFAGGIGLAIHNIRAKESYIRGTNGSSNGIIPMLQVYNSTARYVDQGGGKRKGSFAVYLEPWHADVFDFLELKKNHGKEERRARDLFYAMWIPDLFMKRVKEHGSWSLFCPNEAPGLADVWGDEFEALYTKYEASDLARDVIPAQKLWSAIIDSQIETGTPYMLYKDACNMKSNQQNLGTIRCSNLCTEVVEYTAPDEVAVCNLASLALPMFVKEDLSGFDFDLLHRITKVVTRNLNKVIDLNFYPVPEARHSNMRHRPIGIGVQGLADTFCRLRMAFESEPARELNRAIFETIYHAAVESSIELAEELGHYETFPGSPASQGKFQFDMWGVTPSDRWDWAGLRGRMMASGMRNSLLVAPMPTASTAQILGNNESIEPFTANMYTRRVLSGEFVVVNKHMLRDLTERGLWNESVRHQLMASGGSIQNIDVIPDEIKELYRTVWEIKQRAVIDMAADRAPFICQSQSLNLHIADPSLSKLSSMHFYAWQRGLKTGMYYLRTKPRAHAVKFTVDKSMMANKAKTATAPQTPPRKTGAIADGKEGESPVEAVSTSPALQRPAPVAGAPVATAGGGGDGQGIRMEEAAEVVVCRRRPAGLEDDEPCMVCSS